MNLVWGALFAAATTAVTVTVMLLVRRRAPEGSYFSDGDRASGVFGVLATGFSVLLGFIIFLAFESYDESRSGAETEATIVAQQVQTAQFLPAGADEELTGELVCYARSVAGRRVGRPGRRHARRRHQPVGCRDVPDDRRPSSRRRRPSSRRTTGGWTRRRPRSRRATTGSTARRGSSPLPLWLVLFVISGVIFVYMLFFADRAEGPVTQGMLMGSVTVVITLLMLLLVRSSTIPTATVWAGCSRPRWSARSSSSTPSSTPSA